MLLNLMQAGKEYAYSGSNGIQTKIIAKFSMYIFFFRKFNSKNSWAAKAIDSNSPAIK